MKNKSTKTHRNWIHKGKSKLFSNKNIIFQWFQNYEFYHICKFFIKKKYKTIFEIWCAPGNYLINFYKKNNLTPNGIEYSKEWIKKTKKNLKYQWIKANIIQWDFFDNTFLQKNKEKYDIVYSLWFIEHFENPQDAINRHFALTKKGWLVIITIPNLFYINKLFVSKKILNIHNITIMNIPTIKKIFKQYNIIKIAYYWWLFNMWLFIYENYLLEKIRFSFFIIQRLIFDPISIFLYKTLKINFSNKYTSPGIIIICKKD